MDIETASMIKEGGRRKVLRVRFPNFYSLDEKWYFRTLIRGEIFDIYSRHGHPDRVIPDKETKTRTRLEDDILRVSFIEGPEWYKIDSAPAGINEGFSKVVLERSGFVDDTDSQRKLLDLAQRYSNSVEGRIESYIQHYLKLSQYELSQLSYEEFFRCTFKAIFLAKTLDNVDITRFLDPNNETNEPPNIEMEKLSSPAEQQKQLRTPAKITKENIHSILDQAPILNAQALAEAMGLNPERGIQASQPRVFVAGEPVADMESLARTTKADSSGLAGGAEFQAYQPKPASNSPRRRSVRQ